MAAGLKSGSAIFQAGSSDAPACATATGAVRQSLGDMSGAGDFSVHSSQGGIPSPGQQS